MSRVHYFVVGPFDEVASSWLRDPVDGGFALEVPTDEPGWAELANQLQSHDESSQGYDPFAGGHFLVVDFCLHLVYPDWFDALTGALEDQLGVSLGLFRSHQKDGRMHPSGEAGANRMSPHWTASLASVADENVTALSALWVEVANRRSKEDCERRWAAAMQDPKFAQDYRRGEPQFLQLVKTAFRPEQATATPDMCVALRKLVDAAKAALPDHGDLVFCWSL